MVLSKVLIEVLINNCLVLSKVIKIVLLLRKFVTENKNYF